MAEKKKTIMLNPTKLKEQIKKIEDLYTKANQSR